MSIYGLKPQFTTFDDYKIWRKQWANVYNDVTKRIKKQKQMFVRHQQLAYAYAHEREATRGQTGTKHEPNPHWASYERARAQLKSMRVAAHKLCTVLEEAKIRMGNITRMRKAMVEHQATFPIRIEECDRVDFHFNKKHLEFPWIPMWVLKTKGTTFYCDHIDAKCHWTTREAPDNPHTKGSIRFRNVSLTIDSSGIATLEQLG